jgi:hypothetical protein
MTRPRWRITLEDGDGEHSAILDDHSDAVFFVEHVAGMQLDDEQLHLQTNLRIWSEEGFYRIEYLR